MVRSVAIYVLSWSPAGGRARVSRWKYRRLVPQFSGLSAVLLNCSLVHDASKSHTRRLLARVAGIMDTEGVDVELIHMLDHRIGFGMVKDTTEIGDEPRRLAGDPRQDHGRRHPRDRHPDLARGEIERRDARHRAAVRVQQRHQRHGPVPLLRQGGGCVVTGNEDGVKSVRDGDALRALPHRLHDPSPGRLRLDRRDRTRVRATATRSRAATSRWATTASSPTRTRRSCPGT